MTVTPKSRDRDESNMKRNAINLQRFILSGSLIGVMVVSTNVIAEPPSDELDVQVELSDALSISCDRALNFGDVTLPTGERSGTTTVRFLDNSVQISGDTNEVSVGDTNTKTGKCTVSGGPANENVNVSYGGAPVELTEATSNGPDTKVPGLKVSNFSASDDNTVSLDSVGKKTFNIEAELTIPQTIQPKNLGAYEGTVTVKVGHGI
jgi:hypothetical protein